jgi:hypothetical protein
MSHVQRSKTVTDSLQTSHLSKRREVNFQTKFEDQNVIVTFAWHASMVSAATNSRPWC